MKKLINNRENIVIEMLEGLSQTNPHLAFDKEHRIIYNKNFDNSKVAIVSGGGSGHEPAHAGFVGQGMLSAAVVGEIFTSPTPDQIEAAVLHLNPQEGVLFVVKNYTGDVLNFEIAATLLESSGIKSKTVIVNDDVAVEDSTYTAGRRGVAGTIFVHKIAGAKAAQGGSLEEVFNVAQKVIKNVRTIGVSFGGVVNPATHLKSFELAEDEIEFGLGIHGEPGIKKMKMLPAEELVEMMTKQILNDIDFRNSHVATLVNGLGGTPEMELAIAASELYKLLDKQQIKNTSRHLGNFMTSLEMPGFSITLLKLDTETEELLEQPTIGTAWK